MDDLQVFVKKLAASRGALTKSLNKMNVLENQEEIDISQIRSIKATIEAQSTRLETLNDGIDTIIGKHDADALDEQYEKAEEYRSKTSDCLSRCEMLLEMEKSNKEESQKHHMKLPKLTLPTFNGDVIEWHEFIEAFTLVVDQNPMNDFEKLQYLKSSLKGEAADILSGLPLTKNNYSVAVELLKNRYGSKKRVLRMHIRSLLSLQTPNIKSAPSLRSFVDNVNKHVRGLESLEIASDSYDIILCEILLSKMPVEIKHEWAKNDDENQTLKELVNLVEKEAKHRDLLATTDFDKPMIQHHSTSTPQKRPLLNRSLLIKSNFPCSFCKSIEHLTYCCPEFTQKSPKERHMMVKSRKLCFNCLRNHSSKFCQSKSRCKVCQGFHNSLLHFDKDFHEKSENTTCTTTVNTNISAIKSTTRTVLPTIILPVLTQFGSRQIGVLIDSGSDRSFINPDILPEIKFKRVCDEQINVKGFGSKAINEHCPIVRISYFNKQGDQKSINLLASINMKSIINNPIVLPEDVLLPHCTTQQPTNIDIIIGSDNFYEIVTGNVKNVTKALKLIETVCGWTLHGSIENNSSKVITNVMFTSCVNVDNSLDVKLYWDNEMAGITKNFEHEERNFFTDFKKNITFSQNRYSVKFPWKENASIVSSYYDTAFQRLQQTVNKLVKTQKLQQYSEILRKYEEDGIIEKCEPTTDKNQIVRYIPHHGVVKEQAESTKLRIVFDASSKNKGECSINDCLHQGPNLFPNLIGILTRFRFYKYAITADIEKAFLQIGVNEEDRDKMRFLWYKDSLQNNQPQANPISFRFCRVPFGFKSSPFILNCVIQHHLENMTNSKYAKTISQIKNNLYVDDLILSVSDTKSVKALTEDVKSIFSDMSMNMHKWHSNLDCNTENKFKILGVFWDTNGDTLSLQLPKVTQLKTKREVASFLCSIFDPLGWIVPYTNKLKHILHDCWCNNYDWDDKLSDEIILQAEEVVLELPIIENFNFSRWFGLNNNCGEVTLCAYADASAKMYAASIYLQFQSENKVISHLLCSKSRVTPKKKHTIPQLELSAAVLSSRLLTSIKSEFPDNIRCKYRCYSDSQIVISWIKNCDKVQKTFIDNRVREIRALTSKDAWFHIRSEHNPADIATRSKSVESWLYNPLWWNGPETTQLNETPTIDTIKHETECKEIQSNTIVPEVPVIQWSRFSIFNRLVMATKHVLKFCKIDFSADQFLFRLVQKETFCLEYIALSEKRSINRNSCLNQLQPFLDDDGLMRVQGRMQQSDLSFACKHPIILPRMHHVSTLLIRHLHIKNNHAGLSTLCSILRENFWILQCRQACKSIIHSCIICQRYRSKPTQLIFDQLPKERVTSSCMQPFEFVGVDYFGPIVTLSNSEKLYALLFTCMQVRAIHIEVTSSLSAEEFLKAFARFTSRRGIPNQIRSDNAKTFQSVSKKLSHSHQLNWIFNTAKAPWTGGAWERLVRTVKTALRISISSIPLKLQDIYTLLCNIESLINRRPITYTNGNENDLLPLCPANFLLPSASMKTYNNSETNHVILSNALDANRKILLRFWQRWKTEYLTSLNKNTSGSTQHSFKVGDICLLDEGSKRQFWPLARIEEIFIGRDGVGRSAKIWFKNKTLRRPLRLLHRLEIPDS